VGVGAYFRVRESISDFLQNYLASSLCLVQDSKELKRCALKYIYMQNFYLNLGEQKDPQLYFAFASISCTSVLQSLLNENIP
jgi:hypothetical protein